MIVPVTRAAQSRPALKRYFCVLMLRYFIVIRCSLQANKMVLVYNQFRLATVIEAAMEIAGMQAAQKRLQVR